MAIFFSFLREARRGGKVIHVAIRGREVRSYVGKGISKKGLEEKAVLSQLAGDYESQECDSVHIYHRSRVLMFRRGVFFYAQRAINSIQKSLTLWLMFRLLSLS